MRTLLITVLIVFLSVASVYGENGLIAIKSSHSVKKTVDRLESVLKEKGMTVFTRVNHTDNAEKVGLELRPTELLIFGNPKVGTPLMQCSQSAAIDLPQKVLVYEDQEGQVWLTYNDPHYLSNRHKITGCDEVIKKIENALKNFSNAATKAD
jgi:uncharacterized protein (DUF302 family)